MLIGYTLMNFNETFIENYTDNFIMIKILKFTQVCQLSFVIF